MSSCIRSGSVVSDVIDSSCDGVLLSVADYQTLMGSVDSGFFGSAEAIALFGACASLYAITYVFKMSRKSMGM